MIIPKMWTDGNEKLQPEGTTRNNYNIVIKNNVVKNEDGFKIYSQNYPSNLKPIGIIKLDKGDFIIFSIVDDLHSEIGYIDNIGRYHIKLTEKGNFVVKNNLNFDKNYPITGEFQIDYKGDTIISWVQGNASPKTLNISSLKPALNDVGFPAFIDTDSLNTFNTSKLIKVASSVIEGGGLEVSTIFPIFQLVRSDYSTSNWSSNYLPLYIINESLGAGYEQIDGDVPGTLTNQAVKLEITNIDASYTILRIGFIQQKAGVKIAYKYKDVELTYLPNTGTSLINPLVANNVVTTITSNSGLETIPLDEVLIDKALYKKAELITQNNDILYMGRIESYSEPNQQMYCNNLQVTCVSKRHNLIDNGSATFSDKFYNENVLNRHFQHGEVYAFYIMFRYKWGWGRWYVLNGRLAEEGEKDVSELDSNYKKFQIEDTSVFINTSQDGVSAYHFGFWENSEEEYPKEGGFPTGKVRHFKFPSTNTLRNTIYNDSQYGCYYLDKLGVLVSNLNLANIKDSEGNAAVSYSLGYAKRNGSNNIIAGQSPILYQRGMNVDDEMFVIKGQPPATWRGKLETPDKYREVSKTVPRVYPFELLTNKSSNAVNFYRKEYLLKSSRIKEVNYKFADASGNTLQLRASAIIDYVNRNVTAPQSYPLNDNLRSTTISFIPNNIDKDIIKNQYGEEFVALGSEIINMPSEIQHNEKVGFPEDHNDAGSEYTYMVTLLSIKKDLYNSFYNQEIISTGINEVSVPIFGGDTYICDYSSNTLGLVSDTFSNDLSDLESNNKNNGRRIARRCLVESVYNINLRHVAKSNLEGYTEYYPKSKPTYLLTLERDRTVNNFSLGYNKDYNALLEIFGTVWNGVKKEVDKNNYMIIRSREFNKTTSINTWRDFKKLDYYVIPKNKGELINLVSGGDFLYIHTRNSLFKTKGRNIATKSTDITDSLVYIGVGDIFGYPATEIIHDDLGHLGTQNRFSCSMSNEGYLFCDAEKGKWFLISSTSAEISKEGKFYFFKDNLNCFGDNPYNGNNIQSVYDEFLGRFIITVKNKKLKDDSAFRGVYNEDGMFLKSLEVGNIVYKDGKFKRIVV